MPAQLDGLEVADNQRKKQSRFDITNSRWPRQVRGSLCRRLRMFRSQCSKSREMLTGPAHAGAVRSACHQGNTPGIVAGAGAGGQDWRS